VIIICTSLGATVPEVKLRTENVQEPEEEPEISPSEHEADPGDDNITSEEKEVQCRTGLQKQHHWFCVSRACIVDVTYTIISCLVD
jgi:hypothetical protein